MLNNFDYSKYDIDLLLEHDFGNYANLVPLEVRKIILFYNIRHIRKDDRKNNLLFWFILFFCIIFLEDK